MGTKIQDAFEILGALLLFLLVVPVLIVIALFRRV